MKKIFTLIAVMVAAVSMYAQHQDGMVSISRATLDTINSTSDKYVFEGTDMYLDMHGRALSQTMSKEPRQGYGNGVNFKLNQAYTLNLGSQKAYRIEFCGYSQGDNWDYVKAFGAVENDWKWQEEQEDTKDNATIIKNFTYPIDPCEVSDSYKANNPDAYCPAFHQAGYGFFGFTEPTGEGIDGSFAFLISGNNQVTFEIKVYTTPESAKAAEEAWGKPTIPQVEGMVSICRAALDTIASTSDKYVFTNTDMYLDMHGRALSQTMSKLPRQAYGNGINFKLNQPYTLYLGDNTAYRIEFAGYSQGDNWDYVKAFGPTEGNWLWEEPTAPASNDNAAILQCQYPIDPCEVSDSYKESHPDAYTPTFHNAGYTFFGFTAPNDEGINGSFAFLIGGSNQVTFEIKVYTTPEAAKKAEEAYNGASGIASAVVEKQETVNGIFNLAGQKVGTDYKGIVIKNGKKMMVK